GSAASAAIIFGSVASLSPAGISSAAGSALKLVWPASFAASGNAAGKILPVSIAVLAAMAAAGAAWSAEVCSSAACSSVGIVSEADRPLSNSAKPAAALVSALSTGRPPALSGGSAVEMSSEEEAEVSIGPSVHHDLLSSIQGPCQLASPPECPAASPARWAAWSGCGASLRRAYGGGRPTQDRPAARRLPDARARPAARL